MIGEAGHPTDKYNQFLETIKIVKPDFIVLDTKTKAVGVDENDNQLNSRMMDHMSRLGEIENKPAVWLISHVAKSVRAGKDTYAANATRGAGAIGDDSRFSLWFRVESASDSLIEIIHVKTSYGRVHKPIVVEFDYPLFKLTNKNASTIKEEQALKADREIKDKIRDILEKNPHSCKGEIKARIGKNNQAVFRCLAEMIDDGIVGCVKVGKRDECYLRGATSAEAVA